MTSPHYPCRLVRNAEFAGGFCTWETIRRGIMPVPIQGLYEYCPPGPLWYKRLARTKGPCMSNCVVYWGLSIFNNAIRCIQFHESSSKISMLCSMTFIVFIIYNKLTNTTIADCARNGHISGNHWPVTPFILRRKYLLLAVVSSGHSH